jgi:hypothetical protein
MPLYAFAGLCPGIRLKAAEYLPYKSISQFDVVRASFVF